MKGYGFAAVAALGLLVSPVAQADQSNAWVKYEHRVDGILKALHESLASNGPSEERRQKVKALCKGVTRDSTGGEGTVLPGWARALITACGYVDEIAGNNMGDHWSGRDVKMNCKKLKEDGSAMLKAKPVAAAPEAHKKAQHLGADLMYVYEGGCKGKRNPKNAYHG